MMGQIEDRQALLRELALAPKARIAALLHAIGPEPTHSALRVPEVGTVMVEARIGGGGAPFNLGEATIARASVRLESGEVGHGYCLGRDADKARLMALCDALFQRDPATLIAAVLGPLAAESDARAERKRAETAATQVDFFTLVRGDD